MLSLRKLILKLRSFHLLIVWADIYGANLVIFRGLIIVGTQRHINLNNRFIKYESFGFSRDFQKTSKKWRTWRKWGFNKTLTHEISHPMVMGSNPFREINLFHSESYNQLKLGRLDVHKGNNVEKNLFSCVKELKNEILNF